MTTINHITTEDVTKFKRHIFTDSVNLLNLYQQIATKSAIYPGHGTQVGLMYVALKGCGEAGEFAEHVGKALRDDNLLVSSKLTPTRHEYLVKEVGDELWYLAAKCNELHITLSDAAYLNLHKLHQRHNRGTLQGSGDDR